MMNKVLLMAAVMVAACASLAEDGSLDIVEGTEDVQTDKFYISEIGKYGTNSDLPFLYQRVATSNLCEHATSKRRLAVLRSVRDLGVSEWETNFVAQTIRELEAYPEANLSE